MYHTLEDVVTTYETLLVLDLDPRDIELVIWDDFPTNNTIFQIWRTLFGKGVRILNENPHWRKELASDGRFSIFTEIIHFCQMR